MDKIIIEKLSKYIDFAHDFNGKRKKRRFVNKQTSLM